MNLLCRLLLTLLTAFAYSFSFAQDQIEGFVMRSSSHEPVPFVNIGVIAKNLGTVSDVNSAFKLKIPDVLDEDTIQVSSVGYTVKKMTVQDFKTLIRKDSVLFLDEDIQELQEVVIIGKELKEKNIGKKTRSKICQSITSSLMMTLR